MNIKILMMVSLLCAGCADSDPFQTFYVPSYQTHVGSVPAYSGPPLPPATADPPVEYVQIINADTAAIRSSHHLRARPILQRNDVGHCRRHLWVIPDLWFNARQPSH